MQPPASLKDLADPIYEAFYGLSDQPFAITTDPKFFYLSSSHQRAYGELLNGLRRREGMLLLTGETGTGKTTLCRTVLESLGQRTFSAMILNPYMSGAEVFRIVLRDFGLISHEDLRRGVLANADATQLLDTLEGFLRSLAALDSHAVLVLDEAQSIAPQVLDQIRLLTALEQDNRRLVQIILCGQPLLLKTLETEPMHALNERITRRVTLDPLAADEVEAYIQHRLAIAGAANAVSFQPGAAKVVAELAHGLPRRINVLCDRALQEGRIEGVSAITPPLVKRAARALAGVHDPLPVDVDVEAEASEPSASAVTDDMAVAADDRSLTFGQTPPRPGGLRRLVLLIGGAVLAAAILGYGWYAYRTVVGATLPTAPAGPALDKGHPLGPLSDHPSDDEISRLLGPAAPSGQLPRNPNQLN